jgi:hypothetical protein
MSEPKFKVGDKVRHKQPMACTIKSLGMKIDGEQSYLVSGLGGLKFIASESALKPIEDTPKPCHKKITIKTRREKNGYRVLEVDALSHYELPDEYLDGCPRAYLGSDLAGGRLDVIDKKNALDFITAGFLYSPPEFLELKAICAAAGKRLHDINKRKREEAKIETWEW